MKAGSLPILRASRTARDLCGEMVSSGTSKSMNVRVIAAGNTHVGRVRRNNEDNYGFDLTTGIFVVCDGVGGQVAGEIASRIAVDTILGKYPRLRAEQPRNEIASSLSAHGRALQAALRAANQAVLEEAIRNRDRCGMGTTVVAACAEDHKVAIGYVGDSRAYLIRDKKLDLLTEDHSLVASYVRAGVMTAEEAACSKLQNIILRALGCEQEVEADVHELEAKEGDVVLLCTDGLSKPVSRALMLEIVTSAPSLEEACQQLIEAANAAGGEDNITVVLLKFVSAA
jgi:protein phosphatase